MCHAVMQWNKTGNENKGIAREWQDSRTVLKWRLDCAVKDKQSRVLINTRREAGKGSGVNSLILKLPPADKQAKAPNTCNYVHDDLICK